MAYNWQLIDIPFIAGATERFDAALTPAGAVTEIKNGEYNREGEITKRSGYAPLAASDDNITIKRAHSHDGELLGYGTANTEGTSGLYARLANPDEWSFRGHTPTCVIEANGGPKDVSRDIVYGDVAYASGYVLYTWIRKGAVYVRIVEEATNTTVLTDTIAGTTLTRCRATASISGATILVTMYETSLERVFAVRYDMTPVSGAPVRLDVSAVLLYDCGDGGASYDICALPSNAWALAIIDDPDDSDERVYLIRYNFSLVQTNSEMVAVASSSPAGVTCCYTGAAIFVAWHSTSFVYFRCYAHGALASMISATQVGALPLGPVPPNAANITIYGGVAEPAVMVFGYQLDGASGNPSKAGMKTALLYSTGTVDLRTETLRCMPASRPFMYQDHLYMWALDVYSGSTSRTQDYGSYLLVNIPIDTYAAARPMGVAAHGRAANIDSDGLAPFIRNVAQSGGKFRATLPVLTTTDIQPRGLEEYLADFGSAHLYHSAALGGSHFASAGAIIEYDGLQVHENNFVQQPYVEQTGMTVDGINLGGLTAGTYQYYLVYEFVDAKGNISRSAASKPCSVTIPSGGQGYKINLALAPCTVTFRESSGIGINSIQLALYRTEPDGTTAYRLFRRATEPSTFNNFNTATSLVTYADDGYSGDITTHETIYTLGAGGPGTGQLDNDPLEMGAKYLCTHGTRLWAAGGGFGDRIYYSKEYVTGEAVSFALGQELDVGDTVTGLASLDGTLIVFTRDRILAVDGLGPDATGNPLSGEFIIRPICTDAGCVDARSIVVFRDGVAFLSARGLYLLDRGRAVSFFGADVTDSVAASTIIGAVNVQDKGQLRFNLANGKQLHFDYNLRKWFSWEMPWDPTCATQHSGKHYVFFSTRGGYESSARTADDSSGIPQIPWMSVTTGWLNLGSITGYKAIRRVHILGKRLGGAGQLLVEWDINYSGDIGTGGAGTYSETLSVDDVAAMPAGVLKARVHLKSPHKVDAIRFRISDVPQDGGTSKTFSITGIAIEVAVLPGGKRGNRFHGA